MAEPDTAPKKTGYGIGPYDLIHKARDSVCVHLFLLIDSQYFTGEPFVGIEAAAKVIGKTRTCAMEHAKHLAADGFIRVDRHPADKKAYRLHLAHNPARKNGPVNLALSPQERKPRPRRPESKLVREKRATSPDPDMREKRATSPPAVCAKNAHTENSTWRENRAYDVARNSRHILGTTHVLKKEGTKEGDVMESSGSGGGFGEDSEALEGEKKSTSPTKNGTTISAKCRKCDSWTIRPPDAGAFDADCRCPSPAPKTKVSWVRP